MRIQEARQVTEIENPEHFGKRNLLASLARIAELPKTLGRTMSRHRLGFVALAGSTIVTGMVAYAGSNLMDDLTSVSEPTPLTSSVDSQRAKLFASVRCGYDDNVNSGNPRPYPYPQIDLPLPSGVYEGVLSVNVSGRPEKVATAPLTLVSENSKVVLSEYAKGYGADGKRDITQDVKFSKGDVIQIVITEKGSGQQYVGSVEAPC